MVDHIDDASEPRGRVDIRVGVGRRRRWSVATKGRIVAQSYAPGAVVSASYFQVLGVKPALGRLFRAGQVDIACLRRAVVDAVMLDAVGVGGRGHDRGDEGLGVAVVEREPGALHLDHEAMTLPERVVRLGERHLVGQDRAGSDRAGLLQALAIAAAEVRMRRSSVTCWLLSSGTLRSARMSTRRPCTSTSRTVFFAMRAVLPISRAAHPEDGPRQGSSSYCRKS